MLFLPTRQDEDPEFGLGYTGLRSKSDVTLLLASRLRFVTLGPVRLGLRLGLFSGISGLFGAGHVSVGDSRNFETVIFQPTLGFRVSKRVILYTALGEYQNAGIQRPDVAPLCISWKIGERTNLIAETSIPGLTYEFRGNRGANAPNLGLAIEVRNKVLQ